MFLSSPHVMMMVVVVVIKVLLGIPPHTAYLLHLAVQRHIPAVWNTDTPSDMEWEPEDMPTSD